MRRMVLGPSVLRLTDCVAPATAVDAMREEAEHTILRRHPKYSPYRERTKVGSVLLPDRAFDSLKALLSSERFRLATIPDDDAASLASRWIEPMAVPVTHCDRKLNSTVSTKSTARTA